MAVAPKKRKNGDHQWASTARPKLGGCQGWRKGVEHSGKARGKLKANRKVSGNILNDLPPAVMRCPFLYMLMLHIMRVCLSVCVCTPAKLNRVGWSVLQWKDSSQESTNHIQNLHSVSLGDDFVQRLYLCLYCLSRLEVYAPPFARWAGLWGEPRQPYRYLQSLIHFDFGFWLNLIHCIANCV